jgi:ABC-type lipopolysaccharide export system ATPase subunit
MAYSTPAPRRGQEAKFLNAGEVFGLIGPNGAVKSMSIMMITGLLKPDGG